jgi:hypothetical protein
MPETAIIPGNRQKLVQAAVGELLTNEMVDSRSHAKNHDNLTFQDNKTAP